MASEQTPSDARCELKPIAEFRSMYTEKNGTPRQSGICPEALGCFTIHKDVFNNPEHSLEGIADFSHLWLIFLFHKNNNSYTKAKVAPPRLNGVRVGLFSTRSPYRPNPIGLSLVKIERIEGSCVHVSGADLLDGTPIIDIKPYIGDYDAPSTAATTDQSTSSTHRTAAWVSCPPIESLSLNFTPEAESQIEQLSAENQLRFIDSADLRRAIVNILSADPRSAYRRKKCSDRLYFFKVDCVHVTCWFNGNVAQVLRVKMLEDSDQTDE
ncbi:hypothetical protein CAPTEDRAFT_221783 [Capitella teleta]|uniref:TsaA-like domain-containing protein n=1 Tax=Capitella teleta TaxID=283909 RepID=R7T6M9_CAPTE|nr:hypothetical protein CAPTEDRAFT_221783 [Capitella teleta]|eukprot:ELT89165.1 hypothetical protein CAPTEDRAFT_221783 [Capitella teleta]